MGGAASHQLFLTSPATDYNIVAAGVKYNNNSNTHEDPVSAPDTPYNHRTLETRCIKKTNKSLCLQKCESERGSTQLQGEEEQSGVS